ncbi:MAG: hypothetical protein MMC23_009119 [Stictis urceolatum]|nr:hypothetical protein [Stictis urceolata]
MRVTYDEIPLGLRTKAIRSSFADESWLVMQRLSIALLYLKSLCILLRHYLGHARLNPEFEYSRKACVAAALRILYYQDELRYACAPGGQFYTNKWMLGSLTLHDFLLAAMITALDLYESHKSGAATLEAVTTQRTKYDALKISNEIWSDRSQYSQDARRASEMLSIMLSKVPRPKDSSAQEDMSSGTRTTLNPNGPSEATSIFSADCTNSVANGGAVPPTEVPVKSLDSSNLNTADPLSAIFCDSEGIDWTMLDQEMLERGWVDTLDTD